MTFGDYISYINISDTKNKEHHILENCLSIFKTFFFNQILIEYSIKMYDYTKN